MRLFLHLFLFIFHGKTIFVGSTRVGTTGKINPKPYSGRSQKRHVRIQKQSIRNLSSTRLNMRMKNSLYFSQKLATYFLADGFFSLRNRAQSEIMTLFQDNNNNNPYRRFPASYILMMIITTSMLNEIWLNTMLFWSLKIHQQTNLIWLRKVGQRILRL